jgi:ring-1,2-phenylacetyl-CoA epoxidase subunit PaaD
MMENEVARNLLQEVKDILQQVTDPEIPSVSIVDMGMIHQVEMSDGVVKVEVIPTFSGCPAVEMIRKDIIKALIQHDRVDEVKVTFVYDPPWSSDRISEEGRNNLKKFGIAPPPRDFQLGGEWVALCPYCESPKTVIDNLFGPTACRSILYCTTCKNPFEAIKPI